MNAQTRLLILLAGALLVLMTAAIGFAAPPGQNGQLPTQIAGGPTGNVETQTAAVTQTSISATGTAIQVATDQVETQAAYFELATQSAETAPVQQILRQQAHETNASIHLWTDQHIITAGNDRIIKVWDAETIELITALDFGFAPAGTGLGHPTPSIQLNADETRLLAFNAVTGDCGCDLTVNVWDIDRASPTLGELLVSVEHEDPTQFVGNSGAKWNPDVSIISSWGRDGNIRLWHAETGEALAVIRNGGIVWGVNWSADSSRLLSWSITGARIWHVESLLQHEGEEVPTTNSPIESFRHKDVVAGALWSADETQVLTWGFDGNVAIWDIETAQPLVVMSHDNIIWRAVWDGDRIITTSVSRVGVWRPENLRGIGRDIDPDIILYQPDMSYREVTLNPGGDIALTSRVIWDTNTGGTYFVLPLSVRTGSWHPSGQYILAAGDNAATVYAVPSGDRVVTIVSNTAISSAEWSPDGSQILTLDEDGILTLWEPSLPPSGEVAQIPTALPTPTAAQIATSESRRSYTLGSTYQRMQSFVAEDDMIGSVDLMLRDVPDLEPHGNVLNVSILTQDGDDLASTEQFVPPATNDWLRVSFPEPIAVETGQTYILAVSAQLDSENPPRWVINDNVYPDGVGGRDFVFEVGYDFLFRFDATEVALSVPHVTITPSMTPTITPTPTTIPPAETATVEAAWYRSDIFATYDPREAHIYQVEVGGTLELFVGIFECCYLIYDVEDITVTWSIDRTDIASIDAATGVLTVNEDAEPGVITVTASANGLSQAVEVFVYDANAQPYVGVWREVDRQLCGEDSFTETDTLVHEFIIEASGRFQVSWRPFEVLVEYIGEYTVDDDSLLLDGRGLNYFPPDFDGEGTWSMDDEGRLVLEGIWLGTAPFGEGDVQACVHRFERR